MEILPEPAKLNDFLPAVMIKLKDNDLIGVVRTSSQLLNFDILYIYPYTFEEFENVQKKARLEAENVANILLNNRTLNNLTFEKTENESGGKVLNANITRIDFDTAETEIFAQLEIPVAVVTMQYSIEFINYR